MLDGGRIGEEGSGGTMLVWPTHPVTRALLAASGRDVLFTANGTGSPDRVDRLQTMTQEG